MSLRTGINLKYDQETGEGRSVLLNSCFEEENTLKQMDVLQDWIFDLENLYEEKLQKFRKQWKENESTYDR